MKGFNTFDFVRYQVDPPATAVPPVEPVVTEPPDTSTESNWTKAQQEEFNKRAAALKKAAKAEAEAEFNKKQQQAKDEAEKNRLLEEGKFKDLATTAEKERDEARKEADERKAEAMNLRLEIELDRAISRNKLSFINEKARDDFLKTVDLKAVGESENISQSMDDLVKSVSKEKSYYFGEVEVVETDANKRGKRPSSEQLEQERMKNLQKRIPSLARIAKNK